MGNVSCSCIVLFVEIRTPLIFDIEIPNEVLIDERYEAWFAEALHHLLWRADWVNYDFTVILSIDNPNPLCRLPVHHHVLFDKKHSDEYTRLTNITIPAEQMKALHHVDSGICLLINYLSNTFYSLKLNTVEPVEFAKN